MSGRTLYLIAEHETDGEVVREILNKRNIPLRVRTFAPSPGGISHLAKEIKNFLKTVLLEYKPGDCIVVLHDLDMQSTPHRSDRKSHDEIERVCSQQDYATVVIHLVARDEIESWLLADSGMCAWLDIRVENHDEQRKPSEHFASLLDRKKRVKYRRGTRLKILEHLRGDGDTHSPSLREALRVIRECASAPLPS